MKLIIRRICAKFVQNLFLAYILLSYDLFGEQGLAQSLSARAVFCERGLEFDSLEEASNPCFEFFSFHVALRTGFVQSLEFLPVKKSGNLPSNFPDLEKDWKMEFKSGKMGKSLDTFFVLVKSYSLFSLRWQRIVTKTLFLPFLEVSIDHLFDNLESGKRKYYFGKKSGKRPEFWIQKSVRTLQVT